MDGDTFSFISPKTFRDNIVQSVDFVAYLWTAAGTIEVEYVDEMIRTIILFLAEAGPPPYFIYLEPIH